MFQITEKKAGLDKLEFLKKSKKGDGGDSKGDPKGESAEDAEEAKNRRAQFKELKEIRQQKQRGEDVYTLGTEAKRLWEKVPMTDLGFFTLGLCESGCKFALSPPVHSGASYLSQGFVMFFHVSCEGLPGQ